MKKKYISHKMAMRRKRFHNEELPRCRKNKLLLNCLVPHPTIHAVFEATKLYGDIIQLILMYWIGTSTHFLKHFIIDSSSLDHSMRVHWIIPKNYYGGKETGLYNALNSTLASCSKATRDLVMLDYQLHYVHGKKTETPQYAYDANWLKWIKQWLTTDQTDVQGSNMILFQVRKASKPLPTTSQWTSTSCIKAILPTQRSCFMFLSAFAACNFEKKQKGYTEVFDARLAKHILRANPNNDVSDETYESKFVRGEITFTEFRSRFQDHIIPLQCKYDAFNPIHPNRDQLIVYVFDKCPPILKLANMDNDLRSAGGSHIFFPKATIGSLEITQKLSHKVIDKFTIYFDDDAHLEHSSFCDIPISIGAMDVYVLSTSMV